MKRFIYQLFSYPTIIKRMEEENNALNEQNAKLLEENKANVARLETTQKELAAANKINQCLKQAFDELKEESQNTINEQLEKLSETERLLAENDQLTKKLLAYKSKLNTANGRIGGLKKAYDTLKNRRH